MSEEKIERILATYPPVEGRPGWVWFDEGKICKLEDLREVYEEDFRKGSHEKTNQEAVSRLHKINKEE